MKDAKDGHEGFGNHRGPFMYPKATAKMYDMA
jgi:hypothetical protein